MRPWRAWAMVVAVLLLLGGAYKLAMAHLRPAMTRRVELPVPLASFPMRIGSWVGDDRPLTPAVERIAGNDDYLSRMYVNQVTGDSVYLYIAYSARPRTMVGHNPRACNEGAGYIHDEVQPGELTLAGGRVIPCLVYRFHREGEALVVLNYYVLNGAVTNDSKEFGGLGWRLPNISGDPAWYVAQVQVSGGSEALVRQVAALTADPLLALLPDPEGHVAAAEGSEAAAKSLGSQ